MANLFQNPWFISLLIRCFQKISPILLTDLCLFLDKQEIKAKATENPYDDFLIMILRGLICK